MKALAEVDKGEDRRLVVTPIADKDAIQGAIKAFLGKGK
jgi:hypothetical protein